MTDERHSIHGFLMPVNRVTMLTCIYCVATVQARVAGVLPTRDPHTAARRTSSSYPATDSSIALISFGSRLVSKWPSLRQISSRCACRWPVCTLSERLVGWVDAVIAISFSSTLWARCQRLLLSLRVGLQPIGAISSRGPYQRTLLGVVMMQAVL